jgi:hypothetical protein
LKSTAQSSNSSLRTTIGLAIGLSDNFMADLQNINITG